MIWPEEEAAGAEKGEAKAGGCSSGLKVKGWAEMTVGCVSDILGCASPARIVEHFLIVIGLKFMVKNDNYHLLSNHIQVSNNFCGNV